MYMNRARLLMLSVVLAAAWLTPPAAARRLGRDILNPKTYTSASGTHTLHVDPSTMYGQGEGRYRMMRDRAEVWAKTLPFTLWDCAVGDDGIVAGYAYSLGKENYSLDRESPEDGKLYLVILDARGELRVCDVLPRHGVNTDFSSIDRDVNGFLFDPANDRFIVRLREGRWASHSETWRVYQLSDGKLLDEFVFAHPAKSENEFWHILGVRLIPGTPLILVNWSYRDWDDVESEVRATGICFNLIDSAGESVWELERPGDYPLCYEYGERLDPEKDAAEIERLEKIDQEIGRNGTILRADQPRRFDVWLVKENQRATFEIDGDAAGGWRVTECGRAAYSPTSRPSPEEQIDKLDALTLRHLGTIELQSDAQPAPEIRDIEHFDIDEGGRIGFLRQETDHSTTFVLIDSAGTVVRTAGLSALFGDDYNVPTATWITGDRWLLVACTWRKDEGGKSIDSRTRAWWLNVATGQQEEILPFTGQGARWVASTHDGGFVAAIFPGCGEEEREELAAFDAAGKERWRVAPGDVVLGVTVTTQGRIIAQLGYGGATVSVVSLDGRVLETRDCAALFGEEYPFVEFITADADDGLVVVLEMSSPRVWRINADWTVRDKFDPRHVDGWSAQPASDPDGTAACVDRHGVLWVCDRHSFLQLGPGGVVTRILGEAPDARQLRDVGGVAIDQQGTIYIADARHGITHVFDAEGRPVRLLSPNPDDFENGAGLDIDVIGDGRVFISRLEFSPAGERVGFHKPPEGTEEPEYYDGRFVHQPHGSRCWAICWEEVYLIGEDNEVVTCLRRKPDNNWLDRVEAAAVAPDGSLAVAAGPFGIRPHWELDQRTINLYSPSGEPVKTVALPNIGERRFGCHGLAHTGRYVLVAPSGFGDSRCLLLDTAVDPPKWYDVGAFAPYSEQWHCFVVRDGQELWLFAETARKIERFALPAGSSSRGTD
jgi:hypothetical protein